MTNPDHEKNYIFMRGYFYALSDAVVKGTPLGPGDAVMIETLRDFLCTYSTGKRYTALEEKAKKMLEPKIARQPFGNAFKSFASLVSVHTVVLFQQDGEPPVRPELRLTEEFVRKEWVRQVFAILRQRPGGDSMLEDVYRAMAKCATGEHVSKKTRGADVINFIFKNTPRWKKEKIPYAAIAQEIHDAGFEEWLKRSGDGTDTAPEENVRKAIEAYGQTVLFFHPIPIERKRK